MNNECDDLPNPRNGQVFLTGTTVTSIATYICDSSFHLQGDRNRVCLVSGQWSGKEPLCARKCETFTKKNISRVLLKHSSAASSVRNCSVTWQFYTHPFHKCSYSCCNCLWIGRTTTAYILFIVQEAGGGAPLGNFFWLFSLHLTAIMNHDTSNFHPNSS